jgi:hypothetical protein
MQNKLKNALDIAHYELFSISLQASHVFPYAPLQNSTYGMASNLAINEIGM